MVFKKKIKELSKVNPNFRVDPLDYLKRPAVKVEDVLRERKKEFSDKVLIAKWDADNKNVIQENLRLQKEVEDRLARDLKGKIPIDLEKKDVKSGFFEKPKESGCVGRVVDGMFKGEVKKIEKPIWG